MWELCAYIFFLLYGIRYVCFMLIQHTENKIARLENNFVFNAHYRLTANEQKILLFLASNIDLGREDFQKQTVPVVVLEKILNQDGKKWGSLYDRMRDFAERIISKHISFPTDFEIDGHKFPGYVNWFQSIAPCRNNRGEVCLEFEFSNKLKPFLLHLKEYVKLNRIDIAPMKSGFSIRIYSLLKAYRDKMRKHEKESTYLFELEELKSMLGISGKYTALDNFKRRVLNVAKKEINENTTINIDIKGVRTNRRITHIKFLVTDKKKQNKSIEALPLHLLSKAKLNAYQKLVDFGVYESIVFHQIIPDIKGGGLEGFEDYFIQYTLEHFKNKSNQKNPGAFVKWWQNNFFSPGSEDWSKTIEKVNTAKKKLQNKDQIAFDNRMTAKDMSNTAFEEWYRKQQS